MTNTPPTRASFITLLTRNDILTYAFGTTTCMWIAGYFTHIPNWSFPSSVVFFLLISMLVGVGLLTGLRIPEGWKAGAVIGLIVSLLNMMILGSLITGDEPNQVVPSALIFVPGSILFTMISLSLLACVGSLLRSRTKPYPAPGIAPFAWVACGTTLFLILAGGLVTSKDAGLAVVDWPNSEGYAMFLYPLARMTGGVYYEHAHRLIGSLVGLTTLLLTTLIWLRDKRIWVKWLSLSVFILCVIQGIMGGLRVTGTLTFSTNPEDMTPSIVFAVIHGVVGQIFLTLLIMLAVFTSKQWLSQTPTLTLASASTDRVLMPLLYVSLIVQLIFGAILRHTQEALFLHITMAVIVVTFAMLCGIRMWGLYPGIRTISRLGLWITGAVFAQFFLGFAALYGVMHNDDPTYFTLSEIIFPTAHQAFGAILLGLTTMLMVWTYRLLKPLPVPR